MPADKTTYQRPDELTGELRGDGIAKDATHHAFWYTVTYDCRNTRQQAAKRQPHEETQGNQLPPGGDKSLRDEQQTGRSQRQRDNA